MTPTAIPGPQQLRDRCGFENLQVTSMKTEKVLLLKTIVPGIRNQYDILCGLHSGLPACCVIFWTAFWRVLWSNEGKTRSKAQLDRYRKAIPPTVSYIPCPACLVSKNFVTVRKCRCLAVPRKVNRS